MDEKRHYLKIFIIIILCAGIVSAIYFYYNYYIKKLEQKTEVKEIKIPIERLTREELIKQFTTPSSADNVSELTPEQKEFLKLQPRTESKIKANPAREQLISEFTKQQSIIINN